MPPVVRYCIRHQTHYRYSEPVAICQNQLRMLPRDLSTRFATVACESAKVSVTPEPEFCAEHVDFYGNRVLSFSIESVHQELDIEIRSEVRVENSQLPAKESQLPWEAIRDGIASRSDAGAFEAQEFQFDSPRIHRGEMFANYARPSFAEGRASIDAVMDLTQRIHDDFSYSSSATDVNTPTDKAFELRAGVCQDFSHVQIACLRSIGIPARYISGYLRTVPPEGQERLVGADESHAWVSVYCGDHLGWVDFDPTNACMTNTNHIPICIGRDYSDVSPMRGVVLGGGNTLLRVSVDVDPLPESSACIS